MSAMPSKPDIRRALEWIAAVIGAATCIIVPAMFVNPGGRDFPLPALYFIEIALLGVLVIAFVATRPKTGRRWHVLPWAAAGIVLAFVILGVWTIGFPMIPAFLAFVIVGALADAQTGGLTGRHVGYLLLAAVAQAAVMILLITIS